MGGEENIPRDDDYANKRSGYQFKRELALIVVVAAPVVLGTAWAVGTRFNDSVNTLSALLVEHDKQLGVFAEYRTNHAALEAAQQLRIVELDRAMREVDRTLISIKTKIENARPDPFTGTEGRELNRRIEQLEFKGGK